MSKILSCEFNLDTACVELHLADGTLLSIDCTAVENEVANSMYQRSELDWLICNDPLAYAEREAERYWSENQEAMYLQFLEQDARDAEQAAIAENPQNPVHIVRQIMAVMNTSGAKTVNVTVRKDGKELTFKTETGDLRRDCTGGYSHWHMIAADRRRFFECFGRNAEYRPEEILRITYGRSVLYEANG